MRADNIQNTLFYQLKRLYADLLQARKEWDTYAAKHGKDDKEFQPPHGKLFIRFEKAQQEVNRLLPLCLPSLLTLTERAIELGPVSIYGHNEAYDAYTFLTQRAKN